MTAIVLALAASASWGVADFLGGVSSRRLSTLAVLAVSELAGLAVIAAVVVALELDPPSWRAIVAAGLAGIGGVTGLGALYRGMAVGAIAVVAPISAAAAVLPVVVGLVQGERPAEIQLAGILAALVGVALASRQPGGGARVASGVGLALVAAAGFGSYFVFVDVASGESAGWAVLVSRAVATAIALAAASVRGALRVSVADLPVLATIGIFDVGANGLLAVALTQGLVSLVSVLASLYPVVTIVLARALLGERVAGAQAAGAATALTGVALIAAGR